MAQVLDTVTGLQIV